MLIYLQLTPFTVLRHCYGHPRIYCTRRYSQGNCCCTTWKVTASLSRTPLYRNLWHSNSSSITDFVTDATFVLKNYTSPGVTPPCISLSSLTYWWYILTLVQYSADVTAHSGFLDSYNAVAPGIISTVKAQLTAHPDYALVSTGHR
jgi:hypothetical protein